jgi:uncharacterized protein YndB with AHSA1/START domain
MEKRRAPAGRPQDVVTVARDVRGQPGEVFQALTDPQELLRWWGPPGPLTGARVNLRPGGEYRLEFRGQEGESAWAKGQYQAVEPGSRIATTWFSSRHPELRNSVEIRLEPAAAGTRVTVVHAGLAGRPEVVDEIEKAWQDALNRLAGRT